MKIIKKDYQTLEERMDLLQDQVTLMIWENLQLRSRVFNLEKNYATCKS